ncbi:unnamed protein product, partial [Symbiodinium sp. KB8]
MAVVPTLQSMLGSCIVMRVPLSMSGVGEAALLLPTSLDEASAATPGSPEARILAATGHPGVHQQRTRGATGSPTLGNKTGAGRASGESNETTERMPKAAVEATWVAKATARTGGLRPGTAIMSGAKMDGEAAVEIVTTKETDETVPGWIAAIFIDGSLALETFERCRARSGNDEDRDTFQYANQKTPAELPGQMVEIYTAGGLIRETNAEPGTMEEAQTDALAASGRKMALRGGKVRTATMGRAEAAPTAVLQKNFQYPSSPRRTLRILEGVPGLVLYQSLGGKAWIAAEELSVSRLGEESGIEYLISWIQARFLDLEVARIGRAFSDYFRKMRRRPGQTIRDYNAEYDRLFGRRREVGCNLPQEAAAWVYLDRLQLDEAQELNILASVGNRYDLLCLQQAAVLHDRGQRKPWEGASNRGKKPHYAHVTDYDDGDGSEGGPDDVGEEGIPEEVAEAWVTYQTAKEKYKSQKQSRGYNGDHDRPPRPPPGDGVRDRAEDRDRDQGREGRLKAMKAKSFCSGCGRRGHWHLDSTCPLNKGEPGGAKGTSAPKEVAMMTVMPADVYACRHVGDASLLGVTDTACARTVAGSQWLQAYTDLLQDHGQRPILKKECEAYRFGTGKIHYSSFYVIVNFELGNSVVQLRLGMVYDGRLHEGNERPGSMRERGDETGDDCTTSPRMKKINSLNLPELRAKAMELEAPLPAKASKGLILKLIRDSLSTPAKTLMTIGRWRGCEYREIPEDYGRWALAETTRSENSHPDLVRYAKWFKNEMDRKSVKAHINDDTVDASYVPETSHGKTSSNSSWDAVTVLTPTNYKTGKGYTKTTPKRGNDEMKDKSKAMESQPDPAVLEEIKALQTKLAILKDKANCCGNERIENIITEEDYGNESNVTFAGADSYKKFGEGNFDWGDYSFENCERILEATHYFPEKLNLRKVHDGDYAAADNKAYSTYGMFTHGGVIGVTRSTKDTEALVRYLNNFGKAHLPASATWSSISVTKNIATTVHRDSNNLKGTHNYSASTGQKSGGQLWLEESDVDEKQANGEKFLWRRDKNGAWVPGKTHNTTNAFVEFNPFLRHGSCDWSGDRWCLTYHTARQLPQCGPEIKKYLRGCGFRLPLLGRTRTGEAIVKPKATRSTKKAIMNAAGKLGVLMCTLMTAASSYLMDIHEGPVHHDPIVMMEIGGQEGTIEATDLDKAVIEPFAWEDYVDPEAQVNAHHFVVGATPKELRIHLDGMPERAREPVNQLICDQIETGGEVVLRRGDPAPFLETYAEYVKYKYIGDGDVWIVLGKQKNGAKLTFAGPRPHDVCAVEVEGDGQDEKVKCDGSGITFGSDVPQLRAGIFTSPAPELGTSKRETGPDVERAFNTHWLSPFGPPTSVSIDLDGKVQVQAGLARLCDWHSIMVKNVAAQGKWQGGIAERHIKWFKGIWDRVIHELSVDKRRPRSLLQWSALPKTIFGGAADTHRPSGCSEDHREFQKNYVIPTAARRRRLTAPEHLRSTGPEEIGEYLTMKGVKDEVNKLLSMDPDDPETWEQPEGGDEDDAQYSPSEIDDIDPPRQHPAREEGDTAMPMEEEVLFPTEPPSRRLKRKTRPENVDAQADEVPPEARELFRDAERVQWEEHLSYDALEPLDENTSERGVRETVDPARHRDPDLGVEALSTDEDKWEVAAGDIQCAFLTGGYVSRDEPLYLHQPATGFPRLRPRQLVRIKKNIFGLATSPHEWWQDLQGGILQVEVRCEERSFGFVQCPLDPCIFMLKEIVNGAYYDLLVIAGRKMNVLIREALSARFPIDKWELNHLDYVGSEIYCGEDSPSEGAQGSDGSNKLRYQCAKDFYGNYISFVDGFHSSDGHHTRYTVDEAADVVVQLAGNYKLMMKITEAGTLLMPYKQLHASLEDRAVAAQTIVPMGQLIQSLGYSMVWNPNECYLQSPEGDRIQMQLDGGCPQLREMEALALIARLEDQRLEELNNATLTTRDKLQVSAMSMERSWDFYLMDYVMTGSFESGLRAVRDAPFFADLPESTWRMSYRADPYPIAVEGHWEIMKLDQGDTVVLEFDIERSPGLDVLRSEVWRVLFWGAKEGKIDVVMGAPPSRSEKMKSVYLMEGLEQLELYTGAPTMDASNCFWDTRMWKCYEREKSLRTVSFDQGAMGSASRNRTTLGTNVNNLLALDELRLPEESDLPENDPKDYIWSQGLVEAMVVALSFWHKEPHRAPMISMMTPSQWKEHVDSNHEVYKKECATCVTSRATGAQHRRVHHPDTYVLTADVAGPITKGLDPTSKGTMGKNLRYLLVAKYMVPKQYLQLYTGRKPPYDDGLEGSPEEAGTEDTGAGAGLEDLFEDIPVMGPEDYDVVDVYQIPEAPSAELDAAFEEEVEDEPVLQDEGDDVHSPEGGEQPTSRVDNVMQGADCVPPEMTYLTFAVGLPNNQSATIKYALQDVVLYLDSHGLPVYRFHADKGEFFNNQFRSWLRERGILGTWSEPGIPQTNAHAENTVRWIKDRARTLLRGASFPVKLWPVAAAAAAAQQRAKVLGWKSLLAAPFGSIVYIRKKAFDKSGPLRREQAMDSKWIRGRYAGLSTILHRGHLIYVPAEGEESEKFFHTLHVRPNLVEPSGPDTECCVDIPRPRRRLTGKYPPEAVEMRQVDTEATDITKLATEEAQYILENWDEDRARDLVIQLAPLSFFDNRKFGVFRHGGAVGWMKRIDEFPHLVQILSRLVVECNPEATFTSMLVSVNSQKPLHKDNNNDPRTHNHVIPIMVPSRGGEAWVELRQGDCVHGVIEQRLQGDRMMYGQKLQLTSGEGLKFNPRSAHEVCDWEGERIVLIAYSPQCLGKLNQADVTKLHVFGFPVPLSQLPEFYENEEGEPIYGQVQYVTVDENQLEADTTPEWELYLEAGSGMAKLTDASQTFGWVPQLYKTEVVYTPNIEKIVSELVAPLDVTYTVNPSEVFSQMELWKPAIEKEMKSIEVAIYRLPPGSDKRRHWLNLPGVQKLPTKFVFTIKPNDKADPSDPSTWYKRKARLVVCGNMAAEDGASVYTEAAPAEAVRAGLTLTVEQGWAVAVLDVVAAFLRTPMGRTKKDPLVIVQPPRLLEALGLIEKLELWGLIRALYGLRQSPALWGDYRDYVLRSTDPPSGLRLRQGSAATSWWKVVDEVGVMTAIILVYVDDFLICGPDNIVSQLSKWIRSIWETSEPTYLRPGTSIRFLGMELHVEEANPGEIGIGQHGYIQELLRLHNIPAQALDKIPVSKEMVAEQVSQADVCKDDVHKAQQLTGEVLWLAQCSRPDLSYATSVMASLCLRNPIQVINIGIKVLGYLQRTSRFQLRIRAKDNSLVMYSDAAFAPQGGRSHGGWLVTYAGAPIMWRSGRQQMITLSTAEAELLAVIDGAIATKGIESLLGDMGIFVEEKKIASDSMAALAITGAGLKVDYDVAGVLMILLMLLGVMVIWEALRLKSEAEQDESYDADGITSMVI